ncbi:DeoR/GlpR family DNA-binding transcription regulator [Sedimentitalea sp.]|uniref:DeoR/GlpR family DNA-binding transcription regulator n=1 Tax=Sedimentitalea sp. TaxID=2048915 RepID=UPI003297A843
MPIVSKRHEEILTILGSEGIVRVQDLAQRLQVSVETVRRDLRPLADRGTILKMHGAVGLAHSGGEAPYERRMRENSKAKQKIARAMAATVRNGETIMIDTGTTTSFLARALAQHERLTIITNSTDIARTLAGRNDSKVLLAGGVVNGDSGAVLGHDAVAFVQRFHVDHAVISAGAIGIDGVMDFEPDEAVFAREVLSRGQRRVVISDLTKFTRSALVQVCDLSEVHQLFTEATPETSIAAYLADAEVQLCGLFA